MSKENEQVNERDNRSSEAKPHTLAIVHGGPILPALVAALPPRVRTLLLVDAGEVTDLDLQQSPFYAKEDVGRPAEEALERRFDLRARGITVRTERWGAGTKLDLQRVLRPASAAVALVNGPVLFYDWLDTLNEASLDLGLPWTSAALLDARELHIGPTIVPGKTACYRCYELRYKSNLPLLETHLAFEKSARAGLAPVDLGVLPSLPSIVASLLASDVARLLDGGEPLSRGALLTVDVATFTCERHPVLKLPRCAACTPVHNAPAERAWR